MMKYYLLLMMVAGAALSCRTLKSTTYIPPNQSFLLGGGVHGSYKAQLTNVDEADIEVVLTDMQGGRNSLGVWSTGISKTVKVPKNQQVSLVNKGEGTAAMRIKLTGDTRLSMDYQ